MANVAKMQKTEPVVDLSTVIPDGTGGACAVDLSQPIPVILITTRFNRMTEHGKTAARLYLEAVLTLFRVADAHPEWRAALEALGAAQKAPARRTSYIDF